MNVHSCACCPFRPGIESPLTHRERQIAQYVAYGESNKTIAAALHISAWTVGGYLRRVFAKLGVSSRAAMVARLLADAAATPPPRP